MLDWDRIALWTEQIARGDFSAIEDVLTARTGHKPTIAWAPAATSLTAPPLRFLLDYWQSLAGGGRLPHFRQVDAHDMRPALGFILLADVVAGGRDFRFRLYGSIIARVSNLEMTGRLMSDHPASPYVVEFMLAATRAALLRRQPIYTERTPVSAKQTTLWPRLALPLVDDEGASRGSWSERCRSTPLGGSFRPRRSVAHGDRGHTAYQNENGDEARFRDRSSVWR